MKMPLPPSIILATILLTTFLTISAAPGLEKNTSDPKIEAKLKQIVDLRERVFKRQQALAKEDRVKGVEVVETALCRARIALARERGQQNQIVAQLERIVTIYQRQYETAKVRMELGKGSTTEEQIRILEAQIELERARKGIDNP